MKELISNKVYYRIFDRIYKQSTHIYNKKDKNLIVLKEIEKNKKSIINALSAKNILILQQVHDNKVIDADIYNDFDNYHPEADGAVTTNIGIILTIQTADCVPVLFSSVDGNIIGAAHCGWKSSKKNIIHNVVDLMKSKGAENIKAIIGPAIQQCSYEVSQEYYDDFIREQENHTIFFINSQKKGSYMFDLPYYVELKLQESGVTEIIKMKDDTYSVKEKYPSYRRSCHLGEECDQRILSTIVINP